MSKTKIVLFRLKFIDLYKAPLEGLYHIVTINGRTACSGAAIEEGYTVWISKPAGTRFNVSIKDPLNGSMIDIIKDLVVPIKKTTFEVQAPFAKHKFKLKMFEGSTGNYLRKTHEVKPQETLSSISNIYGIKWQQIAQLNNLKEPYKIQPRDVLKLPPTKARQKNAIDSSPQNSSKGGDLSLKTEYTVGKSETLSGISERSGVSIEELKRINGITDPKKLQSGQTIKLRNGSSARSSIAQPEAKSSTSSNSSNNKEKGLLDRAQDAIQEIAENLKEGFEDFNDAVSGAKEGESSDSPSPFPSEPTQRKNNEESDNSNSTNYSQSRQPSNPIETQARDDRGQTGTPKVDVTKLGDCSCNRDLTLAELEEMIQKIQGKDSITLFNHEKCTLNIHERDIKSLLLELNKTLNKYEINTCIRRIHFLAQLYHESAHLSTTTEFADGTYYNPPNPSRKTHPDAVKNGNTKMGDGPKYRGRGLIQITWKNNYKLYKNYSNIDVVNNPTLISKSLALSLDVSGWFWTQGKVLNSGKEWRGYPKIHKKSNGNDYHTINMNLLADDINNSLDDNTKTITFLINGGHSHLDERQAYVKQIAELFKYPSKCISTGVEKPTVQTSGVWYEPVDNPLCTLYMQSGGGGLFGQHWGLFGTTRDGHVHQGVDLFAPIGTDVRACVNAEVFEAKWHSGYGNTVTLKIINKDDFYNHRRDYDLKYGNQGEVIQGPQFNKQDDIFLFYAHLDKVLVKKGDPQVKAGTVIARSGVSGISKGTCAPHVHFEIFTTKYAVYRGSKLNYRCNPGFYVHYKTYDEMSDEEKRLQQNTAKIRHT